MLLCIIKSMKVIYL